MKTAHSGFTLIELLVVVAIIGILAAVALPFYQGYVVTAKLNEIENAMAVLKSAVAAYHMENEPSWPTCATIDEIRNSLGVGLTSLTRIRGVNVANGAITVTIQNISPLVDGKSLSLTPMVNADGSSSWTWGWSADFPSHLRPKTR